MRFLFAFVLIFGWNVWGQELQVPALTSPVLDTAGLLSAEEREDLSQLAYEIYTHNGPQITIFTVPDLQGLEIEDFSMKVAEKWQLGTKKAGNGILVTVAVKERRMRIEVGEGLEGDITDYDTAQYTRKIFPQYFREQKYYAGLRLFVEDIARRFNIKGDDGNPYVRRVAPARQDSVFGYALPFFVLAMFVSYVIARRKPFLRASLTGASFGGIGWLMIPGAGPLIFVAMIFGFLIGLIGIGNLLWGLASGSRYSGRGGYGGGFGGGGSWGGGGGGFSGGGSSGNW